MKRKSLILVLVALFCLFFTGLTRVSADEESATLSFTSTTSRTSYSTTEQVWEENGIKFVNNKVNSTSNVGDYFDPVRVYKSSKVIITLSDDLNAKIVKIEFNCSGVESKYDTLGTTLTEAAIAYTVENKVYTVNFDGVDSLEFTSTGGQVRFYSITVYYSSEGTGETPEPEQPDTPVEPDPVLPTALKSLYDEFYNKGTYVKESHIYIDKTAVASDFGTHFHNPKGGDNVILDRTTYYCGNYLYFAETNVGFGTSADGKLTEFTYVEGNDYTSSSTTNAMEEAFVTLYDFANDSTLAAGWELVGEKYVTTDAAVKKAAEAFTAPGWKSPDVNYTDYSQVVVYMENNELVIELYVYSTNSGIVTSVANGDHCLFSKAVVSIERNVSIVDALAIGGAKAHDTYTNGKYTITGTVTGLYNTTYGNFYIKDEAGNQIYVYGLYSEDGNTRYDAMSYKPVNGDVVTIYGILGTYGTDAQMKTAWLLDVVVHECDWIDATCTAPEFCSICGVLKGEPLPHKDEDKNHVCDDCGTKNIGNHVDENGDTVCDYGCKEPIQSNEPVYTPHSIDFSNFSKGNSSYSTYTTADKWVATNSALAAGGTSNSNPNFICIGSSASSMGFILNGKTSAKGKIVSPTLSGTLYSISFSYSNVFSESKGVDITVSVKVGGTVVASRQIDNNSVTQYTEYTVEWVLDTPVEDDFTIEFINNSPSNSTSNKDRVAIYKITWTTVQ